MAIPSLSAAKMVCELSDWKLSNLMVQKILYISHMIYIGNHEGEPLVDDLFQAWDYGPVLPRLYHKVKSFGSSPVRNVFHSVLSVEDQGAAELLKDAVESLSKRKPSELVSITHWEKGAWAKNYISGSLCTTIPNSDIFAEYHERMDG